MKNNSSGSIPFVAGYALQNYSCAEQGILDACLNEYQYWYIDGSLSSEAPKNWNDKRINNMISLIEKYKINPLFHGNYKVPLSSDVDELRHTAIQYTKNEINLASELSAPLIIHGGAIVEPRLVKTVKKQAINNFLFSLDELYSYAIGKNVPIYLENLSNYLHYQPFSYIFTNEEEFDLIFSAFDAKFFLDLGHANVGNACSKAIFEKYYDRIVGMAFSNNNKKYDQHLSLMKGTIDYIQIISSIQSVGWKGVIAFETRDKSPSASINELTEIYQKISSF